MSRSSEYTYTPAWWVPGAHLQTLWGKLVRRAPRVDTRAERWVTPDGDEIELRRLDAPSGRADTPRLLQRVQAPVRYLELDSPYGHMASGVEWRRLEGELRWMLDGATVPA